MVRTSLINLINWRTKDIHWWNCGRNLRSTQLVEFKRMIKEYDQKYIDSFDTKQEACNLVDQVRTLDSKNVLESIEKLEKLFALKCNEDISKKLVDQQLNLLSKELIMSPDYKRTFDEAVKIWKQN